MTLHAAIDARGNDLPTVHLFSDEATAEQFLRDLSAAEGYDYDEAEAGVFTPPDLFTAPVTDHRSTDIMALYEIATDYESDILDELRLRAGQTWNCSSPKHGMSLWTNEAADAVCGNCGEPPFVGSRE